MTHKVQTSWDLGDLIRNTIKVARDLKNRDQYLENVRQESPNHYLIALPNGNLTIRKEEDQVHFTAKHTGWNSHLAGWNSHLKREVKFSTPAKYEGGVHRALDQYLRANDQVYNSLITQGEVIKALQEDKILEKF